MWLLGDFCRLRCELLRDLCTRGHVHVDQINHSNYSSARLSFTPGGCEDCVSEWRTRNDSLHEAVSRMFTARKGAAGVSFVESSQWGFD